ncbi:MAG TPA: hypothetical protein VGL81_36400 [Polyangiaceae bacterium]
MLTELAGRRGLSDSEWVRRMIRESYRPHSTRALNRQERGVLKALRASAASRTVIAARLVEEGIFKTHIVLGFEQMLESLCHDGFIARTARGPYELTPQGVDVLEETTEEEG